MEKRILIATVVLCSLLLLIGILPVHGEEKVYDTVVRLHVLANSDSEEDQALKLKVRDAILEEGGRLVREGIDPQLWMRLKKGVYGAKVRGLNSFENLCVGQAQSFFAGYDFLEFPEIFAELEKSDAEQLIARWVVKERTALSVVLPKREPEA